MAVIRALDISQPSPPDWWRKVRETRDVRLAIIRCWRGSGQIPQNDGFLEGERHKAEAVSGLSVAAYCWPPSQLSWTVAFTPGVDDSLLFLAADQEAGAQILTSVMMGHIEAADIEPWIYTSAGSWNATMGVEAPAPWAKDYKLWLARYPFRAIDTEWGKRYEEWWPGQLAPERFADIIGGTPGGGHGGPFGARQSVGPWDRSNPPRGWQHTGTCRIEGHDADLNIFDESVLATEEEDMALTAEVAAIQARVDQIRWWQASQQLLDQYASTLDEASAAIRSGRRLDMTLIDRVEVAIRSRARGDGS